MILQFPFSTKTFAKYVIKLGKPKVLLLFYKHAFIVFWKGLRSVKIKIYIYFIPAQRNWMQPILLLCEAPFRSNLQKNKNTGPVNMQLTGPELFRNFQKTLWSNELQGVHFI